jgi:arginine/lysine/ornithine decarboxylase
MLTASIEISVAEAEGKILSSAAISCPPAIPVVVSGEKITREAIECFEYYGIEKCLVIKE